MASTQLATIRFIAFALSTSILAAGCGVVHLSQPTPNDPIPNYPIVVQGPFNGQNGKTVSGVTEIYDLSGGNYIVRLDGISVPQENGLQVVVIGGSGTLATMALTSTTGSKNYAFSVSGTVTFTQVRIHSTLATLDYGLALLQ